MRVPIIRHIMVHIMAITGTVIGTIEAGEAIGTTEGTGEDMREGAGGTKNTGNIPPRGNAMKGG